MIKRAHLRALTVPLALGGCSTEPLASPPVEVQDLTSEPATPAGPRPGERASLARPEAGASPNADAPWPVAPAQVLDNGSFDGEPADFLDARGVQRVPWWRTTAGKEHLGREGDRPYLRTARGEWARQSFAAWAPLALETVVRGRVRGRGVVALVDGRGREHAVPVAGANGFEAFEVRLADVPGAGDGAPPLPRFTLELRAQTGEDSRRAVADWMDVEVWTPLPAVDPDRLREEIVRELDWIFDLWLERAADRVGPRETAFLAQRFDILTGAPGAHVPGGHNVFFDLLGRASTVHDEPRWSAAFARFLDDFFELSFHPETGLPRLFDVERDEPLDTFLELPEVLRFLLDLAEEGPEEYRAQALDAARRIGTSVLATGVLPDGRVAARFRASDGKPNTDTVALRQLDLPAQLGRLGAMTGAENYRDTALHAVAVLEYAHVWPGTWDAIDPGFDDQYGHYGARAAVLWRAWPDERPFRRLAYAGLAHYFPLWRDALRFGGNVAADQVRCWAIAIDVAALDPTAREHVAPLLADAARAHYRGEQYGNGAWGDVTHFDFDPQPHLQVGDLTGVPQNLLEGLALLYDEELALAGGMPLDEVRARFVAVWESTRSEYRRPFGYLATREESRGENLSLGSLRLAVGLVTMLEQLEQLAELEEG